MKASSEAASDGVFQFLSFISFLSISIGFINLLPIPLFDGGQIISNTFLTIFGNNKLTNKILMIYNFIGVFIFATLIFLLLYYDFKRLL
jgi:regulator of sigma E protease